MTKYMVYPNTSPPGRTDWIEYVMEPKEKGRPRRFYRINLSWMLSNWQCTFGSCPGTLVTGAHKDISCCQIGVHFGLWGTADEKLEEHARVKKSVRELTPEDWDYGYGVNKPDSFWTEYEHHVVKRKGKRKQDGVRNRTEMVPEATKVVNGGCIFANRSDGPAGKPGCAFHVLALRTGRHHSETKPDICWMIPFFYKEGHKEGYDEDTDLEVYEMTGTPAAAWGAHNTRDLDSPGHWCTEVPDHYVGENPVYISAEVELRKMMGDLEYERMAEEIEKASPRRYPMPGEMLANGRKLLPLLVEKRVEQWTEAGKHEEASSGERWLAELEDDGKPS